MDSLSGVGMWISGKTLTPPLKTIYGILGGSSYFNNIVLSFQILGTLGPGHVDFVGLPDVVYRIGDSIYIADEKTFTLNVSSYSNKLLNGTFSGVFKTQFGSSINITKGKFINVPTRK